MKKLPKSKYVMDKEMWFSIFRCKSHRNRIQLNAWMTILNKAYQGSEL